MKKNIASITLDVAAICGFCCVVYGSWMIYEPSAFIVAGMMLVAYSVVGARRWA